MIVIGADTHKATHTFAAVQEQTGKILSTRTVRADVDGLLDAWQWAHSLGSERVWAVEDCRHVSGRLERMLVGQGERVVRVSPKLTGELRRGERRPGKSDEIDAVAAARAAIREGVENLPVAVLDEQALEIRLLNDYRAQLVAERTRLRTGCAGTWSTWTPSSSTGYPTGGSPGSAGLSGSAAGWPGCRRPPGSGSRAMNSDGSGS
jgi:transposase